MDFESANPSVVKSIKQRDLLNNWLRLYARDQKLPALAEYRPERIEEELPDLVFFNIDASRARPASSSTATARGWRAPTAIPAEAAGWRNISATASHRW